MAIPNQLKCLEVQDNKLEITESLKRVAEKRDIACKFGISSSDIKSVGPVASVPHKRKCLEVQDKIEIIESLKNGAKNRDIARKFGISSSSVSTIWKNKEKIVNFRHVSGLKKIRKPMYENLDQAVLGWFRLQPANAPIQGTILKAKAEEFARELGISSFKNSTGWLEKFKQRHGIGSGKLCVDAELNFVNSWMLWPKIEMGSDAVLDLSGKTSEPEEDPEDEVEEERPPICIEDALAAARLLSEFARQQNSAQMTKSANVLEREVERLFFKSKKSTEKNEDALDNQPSAGCLLSRFKEEINVECILKEEPEEQQPTPAWSGGAANNSWDAKKLFDVDCIVTVKEEAEERQSSPAWCAEIGELSNNSWDAKETFGEDENNLVVDFMVNEEPEEQPETTPRSGEAAKYSRDVEEFSEQTSVSPSQQGTSYYENKEFICSFCQKDFDSFSELDEHVKDHNSDKTYSCSVCAKTFTRSNNLKRHVMMTHFGDMPVSCSICNASFRNEFAFEVHARVHTVERPFSCSVCDKTFAQDAYLKTHMRSHTDRDFSCSVCSKTFTQSSHLKRHEGTHSDDKPYSCSICRKRFSQNAHLTDHMRTHTDDKPYSCGICSKCFSRKYHLTVHERTHSDDKPYSCSICKKKFTRNTNLTDHMNTHSNHKPYSCRICSNSFSKKSYLKVHMRTHINKKPYSCGVCRKGFSQKAYLNVHMKTHSVEKPFSCAVCAKNFSRKRYIKKHIVRMHLGE